MIEPNAVGKIGQFFSTADRKLRVNYFITSLLLCRSAFFYGNIVILRARGVIKIFLCLFCMWQTHTNTPLKETKKVFALVSSVTNGTQKVH